MWGVKLSYPSVNHRPSPRHEVTKEGARDSEMLKLNMKNTFPDNLLYVGQNLWTVPNCSMVHLDYMLIFRMHYRRFPYRESASCIKIWNVLEICLNPPHSQNASPTPKLERLLFDWKTVRGLKVAHNLTLNINRIEGFQIWHFTVGKDILLCCHVNEWKRHLVTKRWPFPFAAYYWGGWGGGVQLYQTLWMAKCNSWKLKVLIITVWQDGRKEGKEAGKDGRNEG